MKKITIYSIILVLCNIGNAQKIQSGIYKIDNTIDTLFFKSNSKETQITKSYKCTKKVIKNIFYPLIDKKFMAQYAVLVSSKNQDGKVINKMIILNDSIPKSSVSYSDSKVRKYYDFSFNLDDSNQKWYSTGNNDFFEINNELNNFASDYELQLQWNKKINVERSYDNDVTFFQQKNTFYLKFVNLMVAKDEIVTHLDPKNTAYFSTPIYDYCKFSTKQLVGSFTLNEAKNYKAILSIQKEVVFNLKNRNLTLLPGDFLAITSQNKEWYFGDYIKKDGSTINGKIFKENLIPDLLKKTMYLNGLKFDIYYILFNTDSYSSENGTVDFIKIYNQKGKKIQVIENAGLVNDKNNLVVFDDVNFDGYKDLVVFSHDGGAGPNNGNNYYIYDPKAHQFIFNQEISNLTQTQIDPKHKTVLSAWRDGAARHGYEKYKWIKGKFTQVEYYETYYLNTNYVEETHKFLRNGTMKGTVKKVKESQLSPPF